MAGRQVKYGRIAPEFPARSLIHALMGAVVAARLNADPASTPAGKEEMVARFKIIGLALLSSLFLTAGWMPVAFAATSTTLDILPNDVAGVPDRVEVGKLKPLAGQKRETGKLPVSGNPLWSVPLSVLTATQERPIFSASRRPPPRVVAGPRIEPVNLPVPPKPADPEHPPLALIGAVVGDNDAIAVFLDRANQGIVRLRAGETHAGWELSSVLPREVTLKKANQTEVLVLQRQDGPAGSPGIPGLPPALPAAVSGVPGSYAPFVPRSTPKNGESDGL
jgi:general secretion pathway protein N